MKKQLLLFAILVVSLTCFACSQTPTPTVTPSTEQSVEQSIAPTLAPSEEVAPTTAPSVEPSETPTIEPTVAPSIEVTPTVTPSIEPTPSVEITVEPTVVPSIEPTVAPTLTPTVQPTVTPTVAPTLTPTVQPTVTPSEPPVDPTVAPSVEDPSDIYFDRPADTNLEFWITEDVSDINFYGNYEHIKEIYFGIEYYYGKGYQDGMEETVIYGLTSYPDYADGNVYITEIKITDPDATIFGLTINSDWETVKQVLTENEFSVTEKETYIVAQKGRLYIRFYKNMITMGVKVTNNQGIIF